MSEPEIPRALVVVCVVAAGATVVLATWSTVVAFVGGSMPLIGWTTDGGVGLGLLWVLVVDPIIVAACSTVTAAVVAAITTLLDRGDWRDRHDRRWME